MAAIYTLQEYADNVAHCHINTLMSRIKKGTIPSNAHVKKGNKQWMIIVSSIHEYKAGQYFDACCDFHRLKSGRQDSDIELAAELSVKYDILLTKLCKILGI